jgi:hypothetical protein
MFFWCKNNFYYSIFIITLSLNVSYACLQLPMLCSGPAHPLRLSNSFLLYVVMLFLPVFLKTIYAFFYFYISVFSNLFLSAVEKSKRLEVGVVKIVSIFVSISSNCYRW